MPGDVQLTALQVAAAPLDYLVPSAAVIRVKSIRAEFVDNSAAGNWLPAVQLVSDSGHIIATASDQGSLVTAGGAADASFFPGAAKAAAASAAFTGLAWAGTHFNATGQSIASDSQPHYFSIHDTGGFATFETSDASVFTNGSTTSFTGVAVFGIQIHKPGTFLVLTDCIWLAQGTVPRGVAGYWSLSAGSAPSQLQLGHSSSQTGSNYDATGATGLPHTHTQEYFSVTAGQVGGVAAPWAEVQGGGASTVTAAMLIVKISDYVAVKL